MPEVPWRMKKRPCPFYAEGRCLFADSCNFLHNVEAQGPGTVDSLSINRNNVAVVHQVEPCHVNISSSTTAPPTRVNHATPALTISSPRSPTRSPRMSGLLLALQDVIGPTLDDGDGEDSPTYNSSISDESPHNVPQTQSLFLSSTGSSQSQTLVEDPENISPNSDDSGNVTDEDVSDIFGSDDYYSEDDDHSTVRLGASRRLTQACLTPVDSTEEETPTAERDNPISLPSAAQDAARPPQSPSTLLSPVDMTINHLLPSLRIRDDSIDSGYAEDTWAGPSPLSASPPSRNRSKSRNRNATGGVSFTVESPPSLSSSPGAIYAHALSQETESVLSRHPGTPSHPQGRLGIDLSDVTLPPSPNQGQEHSPNLSNISQDDVRGGINCGSPLPLLASKDPSFEEGKSEAQSSLADALRSLQSVVTEHNGDGDPRQSSPPSTRPPLPPGLEHSTQPHPNSYPVDELASMKMKWGAVIGELSTRSLDNGSLGKKKSGEVRMTPSEPTQLLARSPAVAVRNDSLDSVYGCYSIDDTDAETSDGPSTSIYSPSTSSALSPASTTSPTSAAIVNGNEHLFTPPSLRGRSAPDQSTSSEPSTKLGSPFREHPSAMVPRSGKDKGKGKAPVRVNANVSVDVRSWDQAMDAGNVSTKAAFGFRYPYSLSRGSQSSSNGSSRDQSISPSRSKPQVSTDLDYLRRKSLLRTPSKDRTRPPPLSSSPSPSSDPSHSPHTQRLRPLRLPSALSSRSSSVSSSLSGISSHNDSTQHHTPQSPSVLSDQSLSNNHLLSSTRSSLIPQHIRNILVPANDISPLLLAWDHTDPPLSAPVSHSQPWHHSQHSQAGTHNLSNLDRYSRSSSRLSEPALGYHDDDVELRRDHHVIRNPIPIAPYSAPIARSASVMPSPFHAIATPPPTLLFAIASDDVAEVRRVLESGDAGPNDQVGPQSALAFTLTNDKLLHKMDIVKALLAFGADPSALKSPESNPPQHNRNLGQGEVEATAMTTTLEGMDPATRYYVTRAASPSTRRVSQLIQRSFFRPLTRVRYDLIGQDCALEQLFRVLSMHSQQISVAPIVVLLCGPSGHGKSLLARKFGSLLGVPTHTVNMTTLRSTYDLWQCFSMSPYEESSTATLAQFLTHNEGKRCVVVLDEIEKTEDEKTLWSLLMPWELGRCSPEAGKRHIDVRNVIWLGTSNIGKDLVFDYHASRHDPEALITREEYNELISLLRPRVSARLGASLLSRVTAVLPFVPFSRDEKMAITAEALYTIAGEQVRAMSPQDVQTLIVRALLSYLPAEGARSLYRAVSNQIVEGL